MKIFYEILLLSSVIFIVKSNEAQVKNEGKPKTPVEYYQKLFRIKRKDHIAALESLLIMDDVEKQANMIGMMMKTIVKTMDNARQTLAEHRYKAGDPFPTEDKIKNALSIILENTAFFTDLIVRFPFVAKPELKKSAESWQETLKWSKDVCQQSQVYTGGHGKILHSLGQELGLDEPDPDYQNPFKKKPELDIQSTEERLKEYEEKKRKEKMELKKKKKKTGPKLSKVEL